MEYLVGDTVDDFVLTETGWVPKLDLDPSPYRPGDVVNASMLTAQLVWEPVRLAPRAPYRAGDVVEDYLLTPSGDWRPLSQVVKDHSILPESQRNTAVGQGLAGNTHQQQSHTTQSHSTQLHTTQMHTTQMHTTRLDGSQRHQTSTHRQAHQDQTTGVAAAQSRTTRRDSSTGASAPRRPNQPVAGVPGRVGTRGAGVPQAGTGVRQTQYQLGQVVNGHVLTRSGWAPVPSAVAQRFMPGRQIPVRPPTPGKSGGQIPVRPPKKQAKKQNYVGLLVVAFWMGIAILNSCGG